MISTKFTIRENNEASILSRIISEGEISRAELALSTGLNKASVSSITKKLLMDHLILETRIGDSSQMGGRKPIMLTFNPKSALVIAIDLGYNYIEGMLAYLDGEIIDSYSKKHYLINSNNVLDEIEKVISYLTKTSPSTHWGIVGMTLAIHGVVQDNEIHFTPYYDLDKIKLYEELSTLHTFPVYLHNEANLAALGEYTFSSNSQSLVSISIHSGVGAGIIEGGKIQPGINGQAGEIGHTILYPKGRSCPCGNQGCLEQYASNKAIYEEVSELCENANINSDELAKLYLSGNKAVQNKLADKAMLLAIGINNIIMIYDPEIIVINSSIYRKIPQLIHQLHKNMSSRFSKK